MYKVISANRSPNRAKKNWRIFEKESLERYFGKVLDVNGEDSKSVTNAYDKYSDSIEYIRWYPDPELITLEEYNGMVRQNEIIGDLPFITNSARGFINVQCKEEAFKVWKKNKIHCPDYFTFEDEKDFYTQQEINQVKLPFLLRVNNSVNGYHSFAVYKKEDIQPTLKKLDKLFVNYTKTNSRIKTTKMCIHLFLTADKEKGINSSFRIHVAGDKVISGYARVVDNTDWCAITSGKFKSKNIDYFVEHNTMCEYIMNTFEEEIVKAVHTLELNHQGIDVIIDKETNELVFLEVQPTYSSGYPPNGGGSYRPPYYNPYDPFLVNFLTQNKQELSKLFPKYYFNWLDKKNHFDLVYKNLKFYLDKNANV